MLLQVALNGNRKLQEHPWLPLSPKQIASDAKHVVAAGAGAVHTPIHQWDELPDYVSVNLHEHGAIDLIRLLLQGNIGVEAGGWFPQAAELLLTSGFGNDCLRVLLEATEPNLQAARANIRAIEQVLNHGGVTSPRLLHGAAPSTWGMLADAVARGYNTRIGLEDTLTCPDGTQADGNAALVQAVMQLIAAGQTTISPQGRWITGVTLFPSLGLG